MKKISSNFVMKLRMQTVEEVRCFSAKTQRSKTAKTAVALSQCTTLQRDRHPDDDDDDIIDNSRTLQRSVKNLYICQMACRTTLDIAT